VLDAYGADRTRWPAQSRRDLSQVLSASSEARRRLADAEAFDKLLDLAPLVPAAKLEALSQRIVAEAARTPRIAVSRSAPVPVRLPQWRRHVSGMAALAASLMIGIFAGQSQTMAPAVGELAAVVGIEDVSAGQQLAQTEEADVVLDEDTL
ncbi:MAG: hypothetical protein ABL907_21450, partial [Hyphomicrobium sp.]